MKAKNLNTILMWFWLAVISTVMLYLVRGIIKIDNELPPISKTNPYFIST